MDKEKIADECVKYIVSIGKKMEYEGQVDAEDIVSLGNKILGVCFEKFDQNKSPDFIPFFKNRFLLAIKDFKRSELRNLKNSLDSSFDDDIEFEDKSSDLYFSVCKTETYVIIDHMIRKLSDFERRVIVMKVIDRMSQKDIAFLVGKTEARISQVIPEALSKLRKMSESKDLEFLLR